MAGPRSLPPMPMLTTVAMPQTRWRPPRHPLRTLIGERGHAVEHCVHVGHDVVAVDHRRWHRRGAQRGVQHGALLGGVDQLAGEHRVATFGDTRGPHDGQQRRQHGIVDQVLGVVDAQIAGGECSDRRVRGRWRTVRADGPVAVWPAARPIRGWW
jgi:hypothetical protein